MKKDKKFQRRFISKLYTASDLFKEHGWKRFVGEIIPWLFYRRYIFYSQPIDDPVFLYSCQIPFRLEQVKEKDFPHLIKLRPGFYDISQIRKRIKEGHICFLGWSGQKPIHIRWIFVRSLYLPYLHRTLILYPGEVYRDEAFTLPDYRRKGVYSYAGYLMRQVLKELGYDRLVCMFASWNLSPQSQAERMGLEKVGEGGYWNILGYKKYFWKGMVQDKGDGKISVRTEE